jgi:hypothetical protein
MREQGTIHQGHGGEDHQEHAQSRDADGPQPIWIHGVYAIVSAALIVDRVSGARKITDVTKPYHKFALVLRPNIGSVLVEMGLRLHHRGRQESPPVHPSQQAYDGRRFGFRECGLRLRLPRKDDESTLESLIQSGENLLLILDNRLQSILVLENSRLVFQNGRLILLDCGLIGTQGALIGNDGLLILDNRLLISDHFAF